MPYRSWSGSACWLNRSAWSASTASRTVWSARRGSSSGPRVQDIDYAASTRNIKQDQIARLAQGEWIDRAQNLLITGPCGSGKTYLACALGHNACLQGYSCALLPPVSLAAGADPGEGRWQLSQKALKQIAKTQLLLIIDDWGLETLSAAHRNDLMEIMDDRHGATSTVMISQLPTDQWYAAIGDNTLADAILDRLMHNAHRLPLKGESMRKILGKLTEGEHLK